MLTKVNYTSGSGYGLRMWLSLASFKTRLNVDIKILHYLFISTFLVETDNFKIKYCSARFERRSILKIRLSAWERLRTFNDNLDYWKQKSRCDDSFLPTFAIAMIVFCRHLQTILSVRLVHVSVHEIKHYN